MSRVLLNERFLLQLLDCQLQPVLYYTPVKEGGAEGNIIDFEISYCNRGAALENGVSAEDLLGQRVQSLSGTDEKLRNLLFSQILQAYHSDKKVEGSYYNKVIGRHLSYQRCRLADGVLTVAYDITTEVKEREEKERQIRLSDQILDNSLSGWLCCKAVWGEKGALTDFLITRINPGFTGITGLGKEMVMGKKYLELFPSAVNNGMFSLCCSVVDSGLPIRTQMHYEGDRIDAWYDIAIARIGTDEVAITFDDITETKLHELETKKAAAELKAVFDAAQPGMFTLIPEYNSDGEIIDFRFGMVNKAFGLFVNHQADEVVGQLVSTWLPGYKNNGIFELYCKTQLSGEPLRQEVHYNADGRDLYVDFQCVKLDDYLLGTFVDHTPLRKVQIDLQKTVDALKKSNADLEEFAHVASHDLKEPVRKMHYFAERLKGKLQGRLEPDEQHMLNRLEIAAERMDKLIDDLLNYSQTTFKPAEKEDIDLNVKVKNVLADLEVTIAEKKAIVNVGHLPVIKGNPGQLRQLFQNLLGNALKYQKPGIPPVIQMSSEQIFGKDAGISMPEEDLRRKFHLIEVRDNGIGFDKTYSEKIFNVFTRLHGNAEYSGSGVGLSIVKKVVDNHHGYISASGITGEGAIFSVLFPAD
jgi:signal transduction histidine kinase